MRITKNKKNQFIRVLKDLRGVLKEDAEGSIVELLDLVNDLEIDSSESSQGSPFVLEDNLKKAYEYLAFSDGACRGNPGPGAWGSLVQKNDESVVFEGSGVEVNTTNNRMELQGAIECLKFLKAEALEECPILLFSDSKYVVDGLSQWVKGWKARGWKKADKKAPENVELWQELDSLAQEFSQIKLRWVKGHSGHPQNEYCDQLANKALDEAGF